jgi:hypothetical protein
LESQEPPHPILDSRVEESRVREILRNVWRTVVEIVVSDSIMVHDGAYLIRTEALCGRETRVALPGHPVHIAVIQVAVGQDAAEQTSQRYMGATLVKAVLLAVHDARQMKLAFATPHGEFHFPWNAVVVMRILAKHGFEDVPSGLLAGYAVFLE